MKISQIAPVKVLLTEWDHAYGKTLASVEEETVEGDCYKVIRFTDGSALIFKEAYGDDGNYYHMEPDDRLRDAAKAFFGLMPEEEFKAKQAESQRQSTQEHERRERAELARLKSKYPESSS